MPQPGTSTTGRTSGLDVGRGACWDSEKGAAEIQAYIYYTGCFRAVGHESIKPSCWQL
jgi:hypothetical protein